MSEYIETNAALAILGKNWRCESSADDAIQKTIDEWKNIPAIAVRPVVLCRDCKYYYAYPDEYRTCHEFYEVDGVSKIMGAIDFWGFSI